MNVADGLITQVRKTLFLTGAIALYSVGPAFAQDSCGFNFALDETGTAEPVVDGNRVILPKEAMNPRSTLIYNLILRGEAGPLGVSGETAEHGPVKRVG